MIKTIIDFVKESKEASQERLKLPIVTFYIFLLVISYWKPLSIYFLSEKKIEEKIKEIDFIYKNYTYCDHILNLLILLLLSTISSILFPSIMFIIEYLLKKPNKERKIIKNSTKDIDREEELKITKHKYDMNKILSGNKEIEDYNKSIEDLKKSYEDRIKNMENINDQKDKNFESQLDLIIKENQSLLLKINETNELNKSLDDLVNRYRQNKLEHPNLSKFNTIFENKELFKNYLNSLPLVADKGVFISHILTQIVDHNLHSLLDKIALCVYNNDTLLNLNKGAKKYDIEKNLIETGRLGELISESSIIETYSIEKFFPWIKEAINCIEGFELKFL